MVKKVERNFSKYGSMRTAVAHISWVLRRSTIPRIQIGTDKYRDNFIDTLQASTSTGLRTKN